MCHKFKLSAAPDQSLFPDHTEVFDVEKTMLGGAAVDDEGAWDEFAPDSAPPAFDTVLYSYLRKRSQGEFHAYGLTTVKVLTSGQVVQTKCILTPQMYSTLLATRKDASRHVVRQRRYCFRSDHQSFHVSHWLSPEPHAGAWFVVAQCEAEPSVPAFLEVGPELTSLPSGGNEFSFRAMSLK